MESPLLSTLAPSLHGTGRPLAGLPDGVPQGNGRRSGIQTFLIPPRLFGGALTGAMLTELRVFHVCSHAEELGGVLRGALFTRRRSRRHGLSFPRGRRLKRFTENDAPSGRRNPGDPCTHHNRQQPGPQGGKSLGPHAGPRTGSAVPRAIAGTPIRRSTLGLSHSGQTGVSEARSSTSETRPHSLHSTSTSGIDSFHSGLRRKI